MRRKLAGSRALAQHGLVHLAQLGEREGVAEEGVRDAAVLHLVAQPPERVLDDQVVVERQLGSSSAGNHRTFSPTLARAASSDCTSAQ